jgi:hypothetical protein
MGEETTAAKNAQAAIITDAKDSRRSGWRCPEKRRRTLKRLMPLSEQRSLFLWATQPFALVYSGTRAAIMDPVRLVSFLKLFFLGGEVF